MKKFFLLRGLQNQPKNQLQKEIHELFDRFDSMLMCEKTLLDWQARIESSVVALNMKHKRCKPEKIRAWNIDNRVLAVAPCETYQLNIYNVKAEVDANYKN